MWWWGKMKNWFKNLSGMGRVWIIIILWIINSLIYFFIITLNHINNPALTYTVFIVQACIWVILAFMSMHIIKWVHVGFIKDIKKAK